MVCINFKNIYREYNKKPFYKKSKGNAYKFDKKNHLFKKKVISIFFIFS